MGRQEIIELMNHYQLDTALEKLQVTNYLDTFDGKMLSLLIFVLQEKWVKVHDELERIGKTINSQTRKVDLLKFSLISTFLGKEDVETCEHYFNEVPIEEKKEMYEWEGWYHIAKGNHLKTKHHDFEAARLEFLQALGIAEKYEEAFCLVTAKQNTAGIYYYKSEFEKYISELNKLLNYTKKIGHKTLMRIVLHQISENALSIGELNQAYETANSELKVCEEEGFIFPKIGIFSILSDVYRGKRQLDDALTMINRALDAINEIFDESRLDTLPKYPGLHHSMESIYLKRGAIYLERGEFAQSIKAFKRSNEILYSSEKSKGWKLWANQNRSYQLLAIIKACTRLGEFEQAREILKNLEELNKEEDYPAIDIRLNLAKGIILAQSDRMRDRVAAIDIFKKILINNKEPLEELSLTLYLLSDLLLDEVRLFNSSGAFDEVMDLIQQFEEIVSQHKNPKYHVELLLLETKLALINEEFEKIEGLLDQAFGLIKNRGYDYLETRIKQEQEKFKREYAKWKKLHDQNVSMRDRITKAEIQNYIKLAIGYKEELE